MTQFAVRPSFRAPPVSSEVRDENRSWPGAARDYLVRALQKIANRVATARDPRLTTACGTPASGGSLNRHSARAFLRVAGAGRNEETVTAKRQSLDDCLACAKRSVPTISSHRAQSLVREFLDGEDGLEHVRGHFRRVGLFVQDPEPAPAGRECVAGLPVRAVADEGGGFGWHASLEQEKEVVVAVAQVISSGQTSGGA
jgi:hypothetical protein